MRNLKQTFIITFLLLLTNLCFAQKPSIDSLIVEIDSQVVVQMSIYNYSDLKKDVGEELKRLQKILKVNQDLPKNLPYKITYKPNEKLTIKTEEKAETIIWENGEYKPYQFDNICQVFSDKYYISIEFDDQENLISKNLITKVIQALDDTSARRSRRLKLFKYAFEKDSLIKKEDYRIGTTGELLFLKVGVGVNLIKNDPVIDFTGEIGFGFNKKDVLKNQYYLSYNLLYDFNDNSSADINSLLSLGYRRNFSTNKDKSNWVGLEFGYLISQNGDMFDDDTFRFGVNWEAGNYITISPQLYISSEQTYPAIRIGFGF